MHIQIVQFELADIRPAEYAAACESLSGDVFATIPGLLRKYWLQNLDANSFGGVYHWENRDAMQAYLKSAIFQQLMRNPKFKNVQTVDYALLEGPTRATRGLLD